MNGLFERYVGAVLMRAAAGWGVQVREQERHALDVRGEVPLRPDVLLYARGNPLLIVDAKYKLEAAQADLYQMLAYCHALGLSQAVLVHPLSEQAPSGSVAIRGPGDVRVHYLALELRGGPAVLEANGQSLACKVEALLDSLVHDRHAVADVLDDAQVVRHKEVGQVELALQSRRQ